MFGQGPNSGWHHRAYRGGKGCKEYHTYCWCQCVIHLNVLAGLMRFNPTEKAKAVLRDWHQVCQDDESNAQPAWNKVSLLHMQCGVTNP